MKIIIVRHGETLENLKDTFVGHLPGILSDLGIEQVKKVALRLKEEGLDYIFSSDLERARITALEIAKFHQTTPFSTNQLLREFDLGSWNGKTREEVGFREGHVPPLPIDAETWENVFQRAQLVLDGIKDYQNKNILLVGHDGINRALVATLTNVPYGRISEIPHRKNTAVDIFDFVRGFYKPLVLNCTKHLD